MQLETAEKRFRFQRGGKGRFRYASNAVFKLCGELYGLATLRQRSRAMFHCVCQLRLLGGVPLSTALQHRGASVSNSHSGSLKCFSLI